MVIPSIIEGLSNIRAFGHAIFIADRIHHVPDFADRLYVIERGEIIFGGSPEDARRTLRSDALSKALVLALGRRLNRGLGL